MRDLTIRVIDFEGTRASGIREYGVVELKNFEIVGSVTEFVDETTKTHVLDFFTEIRENSVFAAHEARVEDSLLRNLSPVAKFNGKFDDWGPWLDTKKLYMQFFKNVESYELSYLITTFGLLNELKILAEKYCPENRRKFHSALYDAIAAALLLKNLQKTLVENGISLTVDQLIAISGQ